MTSVIVLSPEQEFRQKHLDRFHTILDNNVSSIIPTMEVQSMLKRTCPTGSKYDPDQQQCVSEENATISIPFLTCDSKSAPSIFTSTFLLSPSQSLFHGSKHLFEDPYMLKNHDNRLTPTFNIAASFASRRSTDIKREGYIYEYKILPAIYKRYGGIPDIVFVCGKWSEVSSLVPSALRRPGPPVHELSGPAQERMNTSNTGQEDALLLEACLNWNGLYFPSYENQILMCGHHIRDYLVPHRIFILEDKRIIAYVLL